MIFKENAHLLKYARENVESVSLSDGVHYELATPKMVEAHLVDEHFNIKTGERTILYDGPGNIIVEDFSKVVAGLLKNHPGHGGIQYWAIGQGEWTGDPQTSSWDTLTVAQRQAKSIVSLTSLYSEVARVGVSMDFIDASDIIVSPTVTNRLEIRATFNQTISGYLREFGLFGGNATSSLGTGFMIDHKSHALISHNIGSADMVLNRTLRLTV